MIVNLQDLNRTPFVGLPLPAGVQLTTEGFGSLQNQSDRLTWTTTSENNGVLHLRSETSAGPFPAFRADAAVKSFLGGIHYTDSSINLENVLHKLGVVDSEGLTLQLLAPYDFSATRTPTSTLADASPNVYADQNRYHHINPTRTVPEPLPRPSAVCLPLPYQPLSDLRSSIRQPIPFPIAYA